MRKSIKRWSVNAVSEGTDPLALYCDGRLLSQTALSSAGGLSPVYYLLISVASCFALSCRAVLTQRGQRRLPFEVVTIGEKALGGDANRLSQISVVAIFGHEVTAAEAAQITEHAKPLCTITNTFPDSSAIRFQARSVKTSPTTPHRFPALQSAH